MFCCSFSVLIYEPENPEAKEFFSLIEEMLLMGKFKILNSFFLIELWAVTI